MYPQLFEIFGVQITSFGALMALGFLCAWWLVARRLRELGRDPELASTLLLYGMLGGVGGAKLYWAVDNALRGAGPFWELLTRRDGLTWYGGLLGAIALLTLASRIHGVPLRMVANCVALAVPFGQALGRVGCFLVGDDYGQPTTLPWGLAFPEGAPPVFVPVHPTQLYEVAWLVPVGLLLWWRRARSPFLFGEYLMLSALGRFWIEALRVNPEVALGLRSAQWIAMLLFVVGAGLWLRERRNQKPGGMK